MDYEACRFLFRFDDRWEWRYDENFKVWNYGWIAAPQIERGEREGHFNEAYLVTDDCLRWTHDAFKSYPVQKVLQKLHGEFRFALSS